jgi:hypothetical protein
MTYRDDEDALRARIQVLEDKVVRTARERAELEQELAQARRDLAARREAAAPRAPRILLLIGVVAAAVEVVMFGLWALGLHRHLPPTLSYLIYSNASLGVGLGFIGFFKSTRSRLALVTAILCFVEILLTPLGFLDRFWALHSIMLYVAAMDMTIYGARNILAALACFRPDSLPAWLRIATGVLLSAGALIALVRVPGYLLHAGWTFTLSRAAPLIHLPGAVGLGAIFFLLRRR